MLVRLLQRFSAIRLRQDAHPAAVPPPGVERSPYAVYGCERVWMRSHLTAFARVSLRLVMRCDADRDTTVYRMDCGSRWRKERKNEERSPAIYIGGHGDDRMHNISNSYDDIY